MGKDVSWNNIFYNSISIIKYQQSFKELIFDEGLSTHSPVQKARFKELATKYINWTLPHFCLS